MIGSLELRADTKKSTTYLLRRPLPRLGSGVRIPSPAPNKTRGWPGKGRSVKRREAGEAPEARLRPSGLRLAVTLWRIDRSAGAQKRLRTALCGASAPGLRRRDGFCRDSALHQSLGVDPVITPAYHRVRNTGITWSYRTRLRAIRLSLLLQFSTAVPAPLAEPPPNSPCPVRALLVPLVIPRRRRA